MKNNKQINLFGIKTMEVRKCSKCKITKNIIEFFNRSKNSYNYENICKVCKAEKQRKYRTDPIRERKYNLKNKYGMTHKDFNLILNKQNKRCKICGSKKPFGHGNFHVDHNHKTGKIRGLLCINCNRALGFFKDNTFILFSAIKYLKKNNKKNED